MLTTSEYNDGIRKWGNLISKCAIYGEIVSRQECNEDRIPIRTTFDISEKHVCQFDEED